MQNLMYQHVPFPLAISMYQHVPFPLAMSMFQHVPFHPGYIHSIHAHMDTLFMHTYTYTYISTYIHIYVHTYMCVCIHDVVNFKKRNEAQDLKSFFSPKLQMLFYYVYLLILLQSVKVNIFLPIFCNYFSIQLKTSKLKF